MAVDIMPRIPESLHALLANLIDYAGLYPPASLPLPAVLENYEAYLASAENWMLNRLVLPAVVPEVHLRDNWRVTLLVEGEPGPLPVQVETLETRLPYRLSLPTYCEAPIARIEGGAFAKVRTGGLTPEAIPSSDALADFLGEAASRRIAFKATAGLHHPMRSATMHGFVNVFVAAAFAWQGAERGVILDVLNDGDAGAYQFLAGELRWRGRSITAAGVERARRDFAHSFGSCSFADPVADLRALVGWLS